LECHGSAVSHPDLSTAANTGAIIFGCAVGGVARLGIGLYGLYPSQEALEARPGLFSPILEYKARIVDIKDIPSGGTVSYGATWEAVRPSRIAVLPVGYADGYRRAFSNRASVVVNGMEAPVRGRVCMDFTMVDVTDVPGVEVGSVATLISSEQGSPCSADRLAEIADTINYDITTTLPAGIPRYLV
jgi:alanine racemase